MWKIKKGFTLIEMMVAIGLMAILSAGVMSLIGPSSRQYARDSRRQADLESIRSAIEMYRNDLGKYPVTAGWEGALTGGNYMTSIPTDPLTPATHYTYTGSGSCGSPAGACTYSLCATLMEKSGAVCVTNP